MSYTDPPQQPPQPPQYGGPPQYGQGGPQPTNKKAIWALVLGILGVVCCGFFTGIPALILGGSAKKEIAAGNGSGAGMATAGVVLGWISIALGILGVILIATGTYSFNVSTN